MLIELKNATHTFSNALTVFENATIQIEIGEFISILGPSGSGKTTLLRILAGLVKPTGGEIRFDPTLEKRISYVFQESHLIPWRNVRSNVGLPLEILEPHKSKIEIQTEAEALLDKVGLLPFKEFYPAQLSGGMKMRVSLARALISQPKLLLMDEPFAALDEMTRFALEDELYRIWAASKMTVVFVTHSIHEAAYLSQRVLLIRNRHFSECKIAPLIRQPGLRKDPQFLNQVEVLTREFSHAV